MDEFVASTVAEDRFDFERALAGDALRVGGAVSGETASDFPTLAIAHKNGVAALETSVDLAHAGRQQALALAERLDGASVDDESALRLQHTGDPSFARRGWRF